MNLEGNDFKHVPLEEDQSANRLVDLNLYCGYKVIYHQLLEGGGIDQRRDFLFVISKAGKVHYNNALEWCSGPGVIGYELLGYNKASRISFMDTHKPAIDTVLETAIRNNITDRVTTYHTNQIKNIDNAEKFDLVVGNPPHHFMLDVWKEQQYTNGVDQNVNSTRYENQLRIDVDDNMQIHKEFFDNLQDKVTDDCDIFISEVGDVNPVLRYAKQKGYDLIARWFMRSTNPSSGEIVHLRPKFSGFVI